MKVKDIVRFANLSTNKIVVKEGFKTIIETDFGTLLKSNDEELLKRKVNSFRIVDNSMHLFVS